MQSLLRSCFICLVLLAIANCEVEEEPGIEDGSMMEEQGEAEEDSEQEEPEDAGENEEQEEDLSGDEYKWRPFTREHLGPVLEKIDHDGDGAMSMEEAKNFVMDMDKTLNLKHVYESVGHLPGFDEGKYTSEELAHWHQEQAVDSSSPDASGPEAHRVRFEFADHNRDGVLNEDELLYFVHPMHDHGQHVETEREFRELDADASGSLTMQEYRSHKDDAEGFLQDFAHEFEVLDQDGNGILSIDEYKAYANGTFQQNQDLRSLFTVADLDKDAKITRNELEDESVQDVLLSEVDEHYHRLHAWARHLGIVEQDDDADGHASDDPDEHGSEDPDGGEAMGPDGDESEGPTDDLSEPPLMLPDIQTMLIALDQDNDGNMSMEEAKVFVVKVDRLAALDGFVMNGVDTNDEGKYTSEVLLDYDQQGREEPRDEIHRVKFDLADQNEDGFLDDTELVHYVRPTHDQAQTLEAAYQLKDLDNDGSGDLTLEEYAIDPDFAKDIAPEFRILDKDSNGLVNVQEYRAVSNGSFHQDQDLRSLFDIADLDKDAKITQAELEQTKEELLNESGDHYAQLHYMVKHLDL